MRRFISVAAIASTLLVPTAASADPSVYAGHITGDPGASFNLTVNKHNGRQKVQFFEANGSGISVTCDDGAHSLNLSAGPFDSGARVRKGKFDARQDAGDTHVRLKGGAEAKREGVGDLELRLCLDVVWRVQHRQA